MTGEGERKEGNFSPPLLPLPPFYCSRSNLRAITRLETLATQARIAQATDLYFCPPLNAFLKQSHIHPPGHKFSIAKQSKLLFWSLLIPRIFRCWVISGTVSSTTTWTHEHYWLPHDRAMLSASLLLWWQFVLCWCKCGKGTCTWLLTYPAGSLPPCGSTSKSATFLPVNRSSS